MATTLTYPHPTAPKDQLWTLPGAAQVYVWSIIMLGAGTLAVDLATIRFDRPILFLELLVLAVATSAVKIVVPLPRGPSSLSLSFAVTLAAIPILGETTACLVGIASAWSQCTFRTRTRNPPHRTLFSVAMVGISVHIALLMYSWSRAEDSAYVLSVVRPMLLATASYFAVNSGLIAGVIGLTTGRSVLRVWFDNFLWSATTYFVAGVVAMLGVIAADRGSYAWALALVVPLYLTYRSYRTFVGRLEAEQGHVHQLSRVQLSAIEALASAIEVTDRPSRDSVHHIQRYAEALARAIGMPESEIPGVKTAALLHDIGNLAIPDHILVKPETLSHEEFQKIKIHPRVGADLVESVPFPYPVASLILAHHERWDGTGYPRGLEGEAIPLGARVLAVVDCFTALMAERPYRRARACAEAAALLEQEAGTALDPALVRTFLAILPSIEAQLAREGAAGAAPEGSPAPVQGSGALDQIVIARREAQVLLEIAEGLGASLSVDHMATLLAAKLPRVMPLSCAAIFLWDAQARRFRCRRASGVAREALAQQAPAELAELSAHGPLAAPDGSSILHAVLTAPLTLSGRLIGGLVVGSVSPDVYADEHRRLLDRVAHQAAPALSNAIVFEQTHEASLTDTLTGLANRRALHQQLEKDLARATREQARLSVLLMDVNDLKRLNDTYGHDVGDRALRSAAALIASSQRPYDLCARYGGDEFVVVLWDCDCTQAVARCMELQASIAGARVPVDESSSVVLSISAGVASYPRDAASADSLLAIADQRMYADKTARRSAAGDDTDSPPPPSLQMVV